MVATVRRPLLGIGVAAVVVPLTTMVSHTFARSTYPLLLPAMKDDVLGSNTVAGFAGTVIFLAYLLGVIVVTALAGRREPMTLMKGGLALSTAGLVVLGLAPNTAAVFVGLFLANAGAAGIWITAPGLATAEVPPERRGLVIGFLTASIGLGTSGLAIGTALARSASNDDDLWRPVYLVEAVLAVVILVAVAALVRSRSTAATGAGISLGSLRRLDHWRRITAAYVLFGAIGAGYLSFLAEALETDGGLTRGQVANLYLGMGLVSVVAAPLVGWLSDRFGRLVAKIGVMTGLAVGSAAIAIGTTWLVVAAVLALGGMWSSYPSLTATYVRDHLDARAFGSAYGTMTIFYGVMAMVAPAAVGILADRFDGFTIAYLAVAVLALVGVVILLTVPRSVTAESDRHEPVTTSGST
ncbi:MAG: MFS transporter [Actinomycetota bacterium]